MVWAFRLGVRESGGFGNACALGSRLKANIRGLLFGGSGFGLTLILIALTSQRSLQCSIHSGVQGIKLRRAALNALQLC